MGSTMEERDERIDRLYEDWRYSSGMFNLTPRHAYHEGYAEAEKRVRAEVIAGLDELLSGEFVDTSPSAFRSRLKTYIDKLRGESK